MRSRCSSQLKVGAIFNGSLPFPLTPSPSDCYSPDSFTAAFAGEAYEGTSFRQTGSLEEIVDFHTRIGNHSVEILRPKDQIS